MSFRLMVNEMFSKTFTLELGYANETDSIVMIVSFSSFFGSGFTMVPTMHDERSIYIMLTKNTIKEGAPKTKMIDFAALILDERVANCSIVPRKEMAV